MTTRTYWLSKYALSNSIEEFRGSDDGDGYVSPDPSSGYMKWNLFRIGRDIHETKAEAIKAAEAARIKKIASLRKQIAKLEALKFEE